MISERGIDSQLRLLIILYIMTFLKATQEDFRVDFPATYNQTKDLAEAVCQEMFDDEPLVARCERNFLRKNNEVNYKSNVELEIKCRSEEKITFWVRPSSHLQLITLVNPDDNGTDIINYSLIEPNTTYSEIVVAPESYFTIWSTFISGDGKPSLWRKGKTIQPWEEVKRKLKHKSYNITKNFLYNNYKKGSYFIDGSFSWNSLDASDHCFHVSNSCYKNTHGNVFSKKIRPFQEQTVIFGLLPLDDKCKLYLTGKYNTTILRYETPSCYDIPGCNPLPEIIKNLTVSVYQENEEMWAINVSWSPPKHAPDFFNVSLNITGNVQSKIVPGNLSEVWFNDVEGEGLFYVSIWSRLANNKSPTSYKTIILPSREIFVENDLIIGAYWVFGLLAGMALFASIIYWRRRLDSKRGHISFPEAQEKMSIEGDIDGENVESGCEDQWEIRPERLVLHEVIGEGAFGVVRRGSLAPANKDVAVKMLKDFPSLDEIRSFRAEMELMKSVGVHPHVVSLVGCCSGRRPLIVAEYCSRGDLLSYLRYSWDVMVSKRNAKYCNREEVDYRTDEKNKFRESKLVINRLYDIQEVCDTELTLLDLLSFCRQIAMGMEFLASNRVVHRDLAARNILVTRDRTLKIADFGLSRDIYQENQYKQKGNGKMPVKWMALESLTRRIYTTQSDVWSFGVVMWEVVTVGGAPYAGVSAARLPRLLAAGYRMPRPANCSPALYEVMSSCWHAAPVARPSFAELHARLDELLGARAVHYLALPTPLDALPPPPQAHSRTVRMLIRGNKIFGRNKSYERPQIISNHYTKQPPLFGNRETPDGIKIGK